MNKNIRLEKPEYCKKCKQCRKATTAYKNLKVVKNTGWTKDIYCEKLKKKVYGI